MKTTKCIYCGSENMEMKEHTNVGLDETSKWYLEELDKQAKTTNSDIQKMIKKVQKGDENARKKLMITTRKEVAEIAKKYINQGIHYIELVHLGNEAIYKAMDTFEGTVVEAWKIHMRKVIESEMVLKISEDGNNEFEEYHCLECGFVMKFKK